MATVWDPIRIGKMELKNRFAVAPTVKNMSTEDGYVTTHQLKHYEVEAKGGVGLITTELAFPREDGQVFRKQLGIHNDKAVAGLEELVDTIHKNGAKASCQIGFGGNLSVKEIIGKQPLGASSKGDLGWGSPPRGMTTEEVEEMVQVYVRAALRAKTAGFDAVTLHGCHGSLLIQFMSPYNNDRTDKYADRCLFAVECIREIRKALGPDFPIIYRISSDEFMDDIGETGITIEETANDIAPRLVEAGADCIDVSAGRIGITPDHSFPPLYEPPGVNVRLATAVKEKVNVPVICVGRINDPRLAFKIVEKGQADIVSLCRPIIADPDYVRKAKEGRFDDIRKCIACNYCLDLLFKNFVVRCAVNAEYGREDKFAITPAETKKKVLVVGGGVGGMETARVATLRGHQVTLVEKESALGGMCKLAGAIPNVPTGELNRIVDWETTQLRKLNVDIRLGILATKGLVDEITPDTVVLATGSTDLVPDIKGANSSNVLRLTDYLRRRPETGQRVVVLGGDEGAETALSLARDGKNVVLVSENESYASPAYIYPYANRAMPLKRMLNQAGVRVVRRSKVIEITSSGVRLERDGQQEILEADTVILAFGRKPNKGLQEELSGTNREIYELGDCLEPKSVAHVIDQAAWIGRAI
ncbi:MAG: NAD(P)/FAD-dependent oxidoreductase [Actinobacteria bacterium]|nr:NAD(P)/FAD-dependent oxidoreductase [Actinomycetota bacterium]